MVLRGRNSYSAKITDTALGTIRSLEATAQGFEERAAQLEVAVADAQKRTSELEGRVGEKFDREERYQELAHRQSEIEEQLDLTKNQAPSQIESIAEGEENSTTSGRQAVKSSVRPNRRPGLRV